MAVREAEITELKPRQEAKMQKEANSVPQELIEGAEKMNRAAVQRAAEDEASRLLPRLEQAIFDAERGTQLYAMAVFSGDQKNQEALADALERLRNAAS